MRFGEAGEAGRASCSSACKLEGSESALRCVEARLPPRVGESAGESGSRLSVGEAREVAAPCLKPDSAPYLRLDSRDALAVTARRYRLSALWPMWGMDRTAQPSFF